MKKILCLALALATALSLHAYAFADDIKANGLQVHTETQCSADSTDRGLENSNISIADNINLFATAAADGYEKQWTAPLNLEDSVLLDGCGVVIGYRNSKDSSDWYLEMKSNARSSPNSKLTDITWEITDDNPETTINKWSPSGTQELTDEEATITSGVSSNTYSTYISNDSDSLNYHNLSASVFYNAGTGTTTWTWKWTLDGLLF